MQLSIEHQKLINKEMQIKIALRCYFSPSKFTKFQNFDKCPKLVARMSHAHLKGMCIGTNLLEDNWVVFIKF